MNDIKIVFMGTPEFAVSILCSLIDKYNVVLAVTQPDKLVGRKREFPFSPVKKVALLNNIEVFQPLKIRDDYQRIIDVNPDIIITCAYGQIIPKALLDLPRLGCINVHASLLPKLRGGAPIHHAIIDGYRETGITIMYMSEKMDEGDIISQIAIPITETDNVGVLHDKLSALGTDLLLKTLPDIILEKNKRSKQIDSDATYGYNIKREEERIDFNKTSLEIFNLIRGLNPWPLANFLLDNQEIKVIESYYEMTNVSRSSMICDIKKDAIGISSKDGIIYLTKIKPFGKKEMDVRDYLNGIKKEELLGKEVN